MEIKQTNKNGKNEINFIVGGDFKEVKSFENSEEVSRYIKAYNFKMLIFTILGVIVGFIGALFTVLAYFK